jgi:HPt (histidine-containing phosphotransfer) domain-containing protein
LTKPIEPHRLLTTIAEILEKGCPADGTGRTAAADDETRTSAAFIDDPELKEIADEFVVRLEERLGALRSAWQADDLALVSEIAHWIKGSAGTVGFAEFTEPAATLERAARFTQREAIGDQIRCLEDLFQQIPTAANR